ncbi:uncharacterized protein LY79DRAFT_551681 [Colletotrichum navitas]|uniref:Uncharacterized protein n=1 Tax=Colletotrichum navitas TaxID=681940 RepID=A0AAD8Q0N9_9PEZI|nr:uncharacterized protein LY79DRAFT_551681 [Colletotrichum navitas]KAK1593692.1 hypothetical protein LY79DRAFT_551681 [Colletotrichum navitas]
MTDLLNRFIDTLSQVLEPWTWFADGGISHFANGASNKLKLSIHNINTVMETDLHKVLTELDRLRGRLDRFRAEPELHLQVAGNRAIVLQYWNINILHFISPVALSSGIMQSGIIVFQPAPVCFIILSVISYRQLPAQGFSVRVPSIDIIDGTPAAAR